MDLEKYQELTGITVPASKSAYVTAQIGRTQRILENMLGFTLNQTKSQKNYYEEAGKAPTDFILPDDDASLLPPDDVINAYRLYRYNKNDTFLAVDPFTTLNKVKLVYIRQGEDGDGVTLRTFDSDEVRIQVGKYGLAKFIEKTEACWIACNCDCSVSVQLAVDAAWLYDSCIPDDLMDIWADMVTAYSDSKGNIKSETLGSHSYTKFDDKYPEEYSENVSVIKNYAGPFGSVQRTITL